MPLTHIQIKSKLLLDCCVRLLRIVPQVSSIGDLRRMQVFIKFTTLFGHFDVSFIFKK